MSLSLQSVPIGGTSKRPAFESITIWQERDGQMKAAGTYRIDVVSDSDGSTIASIGTVSFSMSHDDLASNPDFAEGYRILRDLARSGLQSSAPEYVTQ